MFKLSFKRFIKNKIMVSIMIFIFFLITIYIFRDSEIKWVDRPYLPIQDSLKIMPILFFLFSILSYEIFYQIKKDSLQETIYAGRFGKQKQFFYDFSIVFILDILTAVYIFAGYLKYYNIKNITNSVYIWYSFRVLIIYVVLNLLTAIFFGFFSAQFTRRITGISILICSYFIISDTFNLFLQDLFRHSYEMCNKSLIFALFYRSANTLLDDNYFLTAENTHIYRIIFWILLCIALVCIKNKNVFIKKFILSAVTVVSLIVAQMPSGACYMFDVASNSDAWTHEQIYYDEYLSKYDTNSGNIIKKVKKYHDNFKAVSYDMTYEISDVLNGKVEVVPDKTNLNEYKFTMYHGYKIKNITNEKGEKLKYSVMGGDYINIINTKESIKKIVFEYSGFCRFFYATTQGVNLPGSFAYYPIPGWHMVYNNDEQKYAHNYLKNNPKFKVSVLSKGHYNVNVNLEETDKNGNYQCFSGNTTGLTITGSPYFVEKKYKGINLLYSAMNKDLFTTGKEYVDILVKILKKYGFDSSGKKVVLYDTGGEQYCCVTNTGIYGRLMDFPDYIQNLKKSDKNYFKYALEGEK